MAKTLEKKPKKYEKKDKQEKSPSSTDFVEEKTCEKEASKCKESISLPCFKLAKPNSLEEFLNEKEKIVLTIPDSNNIPHLASSDLHVRHFKKSGNFPATNDDIILLEDKKDKKFELFKERFFRQHHKSSACGLKNIAKSETEITRRMTLNFSEMSTGNSPGMKHSDLKEHLISAMQKKKEEAFKKFKESDNIDNEIASDEELDEGSSSGERWDDSLRRDISFTTNSSEFEENGNKPTNQTERNFEAAAGKTKHEIRITSSEENKYKEASAASAKVEFGSVKEFLDTDIMDAQLTEIQQENVKTHFDDVQTYQPGHCIDLFHMAAGKTYSAAIPVENLEEELKCSTDNEEEFVIKKNDETDSIDNQCDPDDLYCGYVFLGSNSAKDCKKIRNNAEGKENYFKDSEKIKERDSTEESKITFEKFLKSESFASSSHSNTEDCININEKAFDDSDCNGKHCEANSFARKDILETESDCVESTYNFDLEYLTSSAIPSYQPCPASSKESCIVQPLDENSVEEVIQSSTNEMIENTDNYIADTTGRCILDPRARRKFPISFSHCYMQTPLRENFLQSGLCISNMGSEWGCEKLSTKESSFMYDVFASQEVNEFCSGPFMTPIEEKNVKEVQSATIKDSASTSVDDDGDAFLLARSKSEKERTVSSSPFYAFDPPGDINESINSASSYRTERPTVPSSPPYSEDSSVYSDDCKVKERFFAESEEDKSINSALEYGEEYKRGCDPLVHSEEEQEESKISSDEIGEYNESLDHSEVEEEGKISFDEIGKRRRARCALLNEDEYDADSLHEERGIVFEKSIREYIDDEAVLSGDDDEDDDDEEDMDIDSDIEKECGDSEATENSEMLRKQIAPMHMKQVLADDDRAVKFLQNKFLNEGDLHSTGARNRKFVWKNNASNLDENLCEESEDDGDETEAQEATEMMREKFLHEERIEPDNEENFIIGTNKSLNLCVLENTASLSEVKPAAKRPRSSMLNNEDDVQTNLKKRKVKDEATTSGTRAVKNCVFQANDIKNRKQNLDADACNDSSEVCVFNDLQ